jgi:hypothetical protein
VAEAYGVRKGSSAARNTVYIGADGRVMLVDTAVRAGTAGEDLARQLDLLGVRSRGQV